MSTRTVIETALGIAFLVLAYFFFTQLNTLSDTETMLEGAQNSATRVVESANEASTEAALELADAQDSATQLAESANEASTEAALELADAQASATQLANIADFAATDAALDLADAQVAGTEAAMQAADALSAVESTVTQNAGIISSLEAEATEQAQVLGDTVATSSAIQTLLDESVNLVATQMAELETAQNTINEQVTAIAEMALSDTNNTTIITPSSEDSITLAPPKEFVLFTTADFELLLPPDFLVFDLRTNEDEAIETFTELGDAYSGFTQALQLAIVMGIRDTPNPDFSVDNLLINIEEAPGEFSMEVYMNSAVNFLPRIAEILEQDIITVNEQEFGRFVLELDLGILVAYQILYISKDDTTFYLMVYTTSEPYFEDRREQFEASLASFRALEN